MSVARKSLTIAAVSVAAMAVTGTAIGATQYVITSLSQISPSVVKQLHGATGPRGPAGPAGPAGSGDAYVAHGSVATLVATATKVVTLPLAKAPALVQAAVTITNGGTPGDANATCVLNLDGKPIGPADTIDAPAWLTPLNNEGTAGTTLFATASTPGTLTLTCLDVNNAGTLSAQGSIAALTTGTATTVGAPAPTPSPSSTGVPVP
ncbi:MAG: hypothetical protein QOD07_1170 [Frankiaceae bacterium]|nr:hypothetical protein [Frankiaceae bacterium]